MKTILFLLTSVATFGQNLIINENTTLGNNCGNGQTQTLEFQDLNFNGNFELTLKNVTLKINGNINGTGVIINQCSNNVSVICTNGNVNGNIILQGLEIVNCSTLSLSTFNIQKHHGLPYKIYDLTGRLIKTGLTELGMFWDMPYNEVLILEVQGFKTEKIIF